MSSSAQETTANAVVESQSTVEAGTLGFSNKDSVAAIFSASPIHKGELENVENVYFNGGDHGGEEISGLNGTVIGGYGFSAEVSMNYAGAPDMVIAGAGGSGGAPANAYVPNPASPGGVIGTPNDNPTSKPPSPDSFKNMDGFGGATGGGPSMIDADGKPITPKSTASSISLSKKSHLRGMSNWTTSQNIDMLTPIDPMSGKDVL